MSNDQNTYGLSDATLERAAEAVRQDDSTYCETECELCLKRSERVIRAALTVFGPKIREALVREMIADVEGEHWIEVPSGVGQVDIHFIVRSFLRSHLPAAEDETP